MVIACCFNAEWNAKSVHESKGHSISDLLLSVVKANDIWVAVCLSGVHLDIQGRSHLSCTLERRFQLCSSLTYVIQQTENTLESRLWGLEPGMSCCKNGREQRLASLAVQTAQARQAVWHGICRFYQLFLHESLHQGHHASAINLCPQWRTDIHIIFIKCGWQWRG